MAEENVWGDMLDVLKDISNYLAKQDAEQEKAEIDKPPKIKEVQEAIVGGADPNAAPGKGIAKGYVDVPDAGGPNAKESIDSDSKTQLKKAKDEEDKEEEDEKEESSDSDDDVEELKSLLKDIKNALLTKSEDSVDVSKLVAYEVKKALPSATEKMLRKMGYSVSHSDVRKFGVEDGVIKKSLDGEEKVNKMSDEDKAKEVTKVVEDLSKKSWGELGRIRQEAGDFRVFPR